VHPEYPVDIAPLPEKSGLRYFCTVQLYSELDNYQLCYVCSRTVEIVDQRLIMRLYQTAKWQFKFPIGFVSKRNRCYAPSFHLMFFVFFSGGLQSAYWTRNLRKMGNKQTLIVKTLRKLLKRRKFQSKRLWWDEKFSTQANKFQRKIIQKERGNLELKKWSFGTNLCFSVLLSSLIARIEIDISTCTSEGWERKKEYFLYIWKRNIRSASEQQREKVIDEATQEGVGASQYANSTGWRDGEGRGYDFILFSN
jgi:hypothetical protein